jgi:hypothetical protein
MAKKGAASGAQLIKPLTRDQLGAPDALARIFSKEQLRRAFRRIVKRDKDDLVTHPLKKPLLIAFEEELCDQLADAVPHGRWFPTGAYLCLTLKRSGAFRELVFPTLIDARTETLAPAPLGASATGAESKFGEDADHECCGLPGPTPSRCEHRFGRSKAAARRRRALAGDRGLVWTGSTHDSGLGQDYAQSLFTRPPTSDRCAETKGDRRRTADAILADTRRVLNSCISTVNGAPSITARNLPLVTIIMNASKHRGSERPGFGRLADEEANAPSPIRRCYAISIAGTTPWSPEGHIGD